MSIITKSVIISKTDLLDEYATQIEIDDLGGGEFVRISQPNITDSKGISIREFGEWIVIRTQIDRMFADIERLDKVSRPTSSSELKSKRLRGVL